LPSSFRTCASKPATGAGNSSTTLSVSMSMRFSSRATASPAFLCHCSRVASATDSDSCGTLTSMRAIFLYSGEEFDSGRFLRARTRLAERRGDQFLLLRIVLVVVADGRRSRRGAPGVGELLAVLQRLGDV